MAGLATGIGGAITAISSVVGIVGTVAGAAIQAQAIQQQADATAKMARAQAQQYEVKADQERAAAWVQADREKRARNQLVGRQEAVAAASGFEPTGGDYLGAEGGGLITDLFSLGTLNAMQAIYEGEANAEGLRYAATLKEIEAQDALKAGRIGAAATMIGGFTGLASSLSGLASSRSKASDLNYG